MTPEKTTHISQSNDEIDLIDLLSKLLAILRRRFLLFFVFCFLGAVLGFVFKLTQAPVYATKMVIESKVLGYAEVSPLIQTLQELIIEKNRQVLAQKLNTSPLIAGKLKNIKSINILQEEMGRPEKDYLQSAKIAIPIKTSDNQFLPEFEKGILHYLENNAYVKSRIQLKVNQLRAQIAKLDKEIQLMDSLKLNIQSLTSKPQSNTVYLPDLGNLFEQSSVLYEDKLKLEYELKFSEHFQLMEGFTSFKKPTSLGFGAYGSIGLGVGLLLAVMVVFVLELNRVLRKRQG